MRMKVIIIDTHQYKLCKNSVTSTYVLSTHAMYCTVVLCAIAAPIAALVLWQRWAWFAVKRSSHAHPQKEDTLEEDKFLNLSIGHVSMTAWFCLQ